MIHKIIISSLVIACSVSTVQADTFSNTQTSSSIVQQRLLGLQAKAAVSEFAAIDIDELKYWDCGELALNAAKANREKKSILEQADALRIAGEQQALEQKKEAEVQAYQDQQSALTPQRGGGASLLALIGKSASTLGAGTPIGMLGNLVSNLAGASSQAQPTAVSTLAPVATTTETVTQTKTSVNDQEANRLIKKFEKHDADLENIRILQKTKQCV